MAQQEENKIIEEAKYVLHQGEEEKRHNLKEANQHQAHMLILHQGEEGKKAILIATIKEKGMINPISNVIIAINLSTLHQNVGKINMT